MLGTAVPTGKVSALGLGGATITVSGVTNPNAKATVNATFSAPGEYILRVEGTDSTGSGGGGFQCCWTNAHVGVTVK